MQQLESRGFPQVNVNPILFSTAVVLLLLGLAWGLRKPRKRKSLPADPRMLEVPGQRHATRLPQIHQALAAEDYVFLAKSASQKVQRQVRRDRRAITLSYLAALREDFQCLLEMAKIIAALSPEVAAAQEFKTALLAARFLWRYEMTRWKVLAGAVSTPQMHGLSNLVSDLSIRIEAALKELGERAAAAAQLASTVNRSGLDAV